MQTKQKKLLLCSLILIAALLFFAALFLIIPLEQQAYAKTDDAEAESVVLTGTGSAQNPYSGYIASSQNTWVSINTPCLFGGSNASESSPDSYSVIGFRIKISGIYTLSITAQTYSESVYIHAGITTRDGSSAQESVMQPTEIKYNSGGTSNMSVFEVDLQAGVDYMLTIRGDERGKDIYVRNARLDFVAESSRYPLPDIELSGIDGDTVDGTLNSNYTLPVPSSPVAETNEVSVTVYAPDGTCIIPTTDWGELTDKSFYLSATGNYTVRYATPENNYATRTYVVRVAGTCAPADKFEINTLNYDTISGYTINPNLGIGGSNQKASGSISFLFDTYTTLQGSPLSLELEGFSDGGDNEVEITLDNNSPVRYTFTSSDSPSQLYRVGIVGNLNGENSSSGTLRCRLTVKGLTENGKLTLKSVKGTVSYQTQDLPILDKDFTDIYLTDTNAIISGNFTQTTGGLLGFHATATSQATYIVNASTGGDYFLIIDYSYLYGITTEAEVTVISNDKEALITLPLNGTTTPTTEYNAYRITLNKGENSLTVRHAKGKGYYLKNITISNDLTPPVLTIEGSKREFDAFTDTPLNLPYGTVSDNDTNARLIAKVISDNAAYATIEGDGTQSNPFCFTATEQGEYRVAIAAADSVNNYSDQIVLTVIVTENGKPVIHVERSLVKVKSGYLLAFPQATATFGDQDVSSSICVTLTTEDGTKLLDSVPLSEASFRAIEVGKYTLDYTCTVSDGSEDCAAYVKQIPVLVTPTSSINGYSSEITLSGGFHANNGAIVHPGDSAYAQEDGITFGFRLSSAGEYRLGVTLNLYSANYVLYVSIDGDEFRKITANSGANPTTAYCDKTFQLKSGKHTVILLGGTVGGDAWLTEMIIESITGNVRKIITADDMVASDNYQAFGDVRYTQGTLGRMNLNPNPRISYTVSTEVSGWYNVMITYVRTNTADSVPLLRLTTGNAQFDLEFSSTNTQVATLSGKYYLNYGENAICLEGISSRGYEIRSIEFTFDEQVEITPAVITVPDSSRTVLPNEQFTVKQASVTDGDAENLLLCVKFNGVTFYRGENKEMTFSAPYEGTYEITYFYRSQNGISAPSVTVSITVQSEASDNEPQIPADTEDSDGLASWVIPTIAVLATVVIVAVCGLTAWLLLKNKKVNKTKIQDTPNDLDKNK